MNLPDIFVHNVNNVLKAHAATWLAQLPSIVKTLAESLQLTDVHIMPNLSYTFIARAYSSLYEQQVILKICITQDVFVHEEAALRYFNGNGCVKLLAADPLYNAMLLEDIQPGTSLKALWPDDDILAVTYTAALIKQMHQKPIASTKHIRTVSGWLEALNTCSDTRMPQHHLSKAKKLAHELISTQGELYFLHGDLHHENILQAPHQTWKAIDPHGVVGELTYEVGAFIRNPFPELTAHPYAQDIVNKRIDLFAKLLELDRQRIADWCYVQAVLAACWDLQDDTTHFATHIQCMDLMALCN